MVVRGVFDSYFKSMIEYVEEVGKAFKLDQKLTMEVFQMSVNVQLSQLSKMWKKSVAQQATYSVVADGNYVGDLKEMKLGQAKNTGRIQVVSTYEIADGDYQGKTVKRFDGLDNETSMGYFKGYCEIIGLDIPEDLELLQDTMDEFVANNTDLFNITVKTTKGEGDKTYSNVYVNGISEYTKAEEEQAEEEEAAEEEQTEEEEAAEEEEQAEEAEEVKAPLKQFKKPVQTSKPVASKPVASKPVAKPLPRKK